MRLRVEKDDSRLRRCRDPARTPDVLITPPGNAPCQRYIFFGRSGATRCRGYPGRTEGGPAGSRGAYWVCPRGRRCAKIDGNCRRAPPEIRMRILHTGDWHLADRLGRIDRTDDLRRAVERVGAYCRQENVDLLLVA